MLKIPALVRLYENVLQEASGLFDKFTDKFDEFKKMVEDECEKDYGQDYKDKIDNVLGPGYTDKFIKKLWDKFYSPHEAHGEVGFIFDSATNDPNSIQHYPHIKNCDPYQRTDYDDAADDYFDRAIHPYKGYFNGHAGITPGGIKANKIAKHKGDLDSMDDL